MAMFKAEKSYVVDQSQSEVLNDLKEAFESIGKVQDVDAGAGKIKGQTRFGLQKVKIEATLEALDGQTKITYNGKSDDAQGIGAQKGIERLFETMQNLDNLDYQPSKTGISFGQVIANVLAFIIGVIIYVIIDNWWIATLIFTIFVVVANSIFSNRKKSEK